MPRQPTTHQLDLFANQHAAQSVQVSPWQALPEETRRRLTRLMVRLILDHTDGNRAAQREGAAHDAREDQAAPFGAQRDLVWSAVVGLSGPAQPRERHASRGDA